MVTQSPPHFYIDWFVIMNRAFQYVRFTKYSRTLKCNQKRPAFIAGFWPFIVLNEGNCVLDTERIVMFCEIGHCYWQPLSFARTMFQFSIYFFHFFSISQSFKAWMCFKPVETDGHHCIRFISWVWKMEKERELKCFITRYLDRVTRYNRKKYG